MTYQGPKFAGKYGDNFHTIWKILGNRLRGESFKNSGIQDHPISFDGVFWMGHMSTCPDKDKYADWTMAEICNQNDIDRPANQICFHKEM